MQGYTPCCTQMSTNTNSFQILLEAEQQASALVNEARQCKMNKLNVSFK